MTSPTNGSGNSAGAAPATQAINIQGVDFTAPAPYAEGHPCSSAEALELNKILAENLRNNFARQVKEAQGHPEGTERTEALAALQSKFTEYATSYTFSGRRATRTAVDPVDREARKIAKSLLVEKMKEKGMSTKDYTDDWFDARVTALLGKNPAIKDEAQRRIDATKQVAQATLGEDLGM